MNRAFFHREAIRDSENQNGRPFLLNFGRLGQVLSASFQGMNAWLFFCW